MSSPQQQQSWWPGPGKLAAGGLAAYSAGTNAMIRGAGQGSRQALLRGALSSAPPMAKAVGLGGLALGSYAMSKAKSVANDYDDRNS